MKLKELESNLQNVQAFSNAKLNYEQYITTPHLASNILFTIESQYGDLGDKIVCDLGCGTGMLSIGASLLGAQFVHSIDIDVDALGICKENIGNFDIDNIELVNADCKQLLRLSETVDIFCNYKFDTCLMNPPFGTKFQDKLSNSEDSKFGIDMQFLKLASRLSTNSIYSLNKTVTRDYIRKFSAKLGLSMEVISELRYNIPKVEKSGKKTVTSKAKPEVDIEVDFLRFEFI